MKTTQAVLFGEGEPERPASLDRLAHRREVDRQRQLRWRRRHQFAPPLYDEAEWVATARPSVRTCSA